MGERTGIAWTDHTFNPWRGCTKVSPGCEHCYAEKLSLRNPGVLGEWGPNGKRAVAAESYWRDPERWNAKAERDGVRRRVFCASLSDVFEDRDDLLPHRWRLFRLIEKTPNLDWLLLTKRPQHASRLAQAAGWDGEWPSSVWAGTTAEDQPRADVRIPLLLQIPAAVRFVSYEPAIGLVDFSGFMSASGFVHEEEAGATERQYTEAIVNGEPGHDPWLPSLSWVIVGGESGPGARPMHPDWASSVLSQCREAGVPVFFKQRGAWTPIDQPWEQDSPKRLGPNESWLNRAGGQGFHGEDVWRMRRTGGHGADPSEWPENLRVQEFPESREGEAA